MKAQLKKANAVLEPELRELCGDLDAIQRAKTAAKFMRWADQLSESAMLIDPQIIPQVPAPKVPRGFFLLNLATWQQDRIRKRAHECGCDLRSVIGWAITHTLLHLEERLRVARLCGVRPHECWLMVGRWDERN